jgi:Fe-S-cluster containining protein
MKSLMRECGECTACCVALPNRELNKPGFSPCVHLTEAGCGIYAQRPYTCRTFRCVWLDGFLSTDHRPDKFGLVIEHVEDYLRVWEAVPNALAEPNVRWQLKKLMGRTGAKVVFAWRYGTPDATGDWMWMQPDNVHESWLRIARQEQTSDAGSPNSESNPPAASAS